MYPSTPIARRADETYDDFAKRAAAYRRNYTMWQNVCDALNAR